jgi:DNA-binding transcriptional MerR regulator
MKMRELEERTGVHRETIRVYLRYELVPPPSRPRKTTADYGEAVRRLQQDSRLTLPQIKALMNGDANEKRVSANVFSHLEQIVAARVGLDDHLVSLDALAIRYKHARKDARALAAFDAIGIIPDEAGDAVTLTDAELLSIWGATKASSRISISARRCSISTWKRRASSADGRRALSSIAPRGGSTRKRRR